MQRVSNLSILGMLIMYMLSALFGYLTFYGKINYKRIDMKFTNVIFSTASCCSQTAIFLLCFPSVTDFVEAELLHTFTKVYKFDTLLLMVRLAVLTAVTLTVPIVLFPVSTPCTKNTARFCWILKKQPLLYFIN